ncbi:hypothetical protein D3C72_1506630 [compost metagenome]
MLLGIVGKRVLAAKRGARLFQRQIVHDPAVVVERPVDTVELVAGHDICPHLALDIGKPLVVGFAEGLKGLHELIEGGRHRIGHGLHLRCNSHRGRFRHLFCHVVSLWVIVRKSAFECRVEQRAGSATHVAHQLGLAVAEEAGVLDVGNPRGRQHREGHDRNFPEIGLQNAPDA